MGELRVRNLDDYVVLEFKERAARHGRSVERELREHLTAEAMRPRLEIADELQRLSAHIKAECHDLPDSTRLIREERDR